MWLGYVHVADVDATVAAAQRDGATLCVPPTAIPNVGRFAMILDPQGAPVYVMTPLPQPGQSQSFAAKVGHCQWNELVTSDPVAAAAFYIKHMGWEKGDVMTMGPLGDYQFLIGGGQRFGAVMKRTEGPSIWRYYFGVDDIDRAARAITAGGGRLRGELQQVPGGAWAAVAFDPQGVEFGISGPRKVAHHDADFPRFRPTTSGTRRGWCTRPSAARTCRRHRPRGCVRWPKRWCTAFAPRAASESGLDAFLLQYSLSSREGVILLCLAESLLRIPDADTADRLIAEKIRAGDWGAHAGESAIAVRQCLHLEPDAHRPHRARARSSRTRASRAIRAATGGAARRTGGARRAGAGHAHPRHAVRHGTLDRRGIAPRARARTTGRWRYSFDMLGEAALSWADAERHLPGLCCTPSRRSPRRTCDSDARAERASISVKLSALHPRYEPGRAPSACWPSSCRACWHLAQRAADLGVPLTIDAEEADRLELSLAVVDARCWQRRPWPAGRAWAWPCRPTSGARRPMLDWLIELAARNRRHLNVRLVKGAYWDSEIKRAQERGLAGYPVFTRKANTDVA